MQESSKAKISEAQRRLWADPAYRVSQRRKYRDAYERGRRFGGCIQTESDELDFIPRLRVSQITRYYDRTLDRWVEDEVPS